MTDTKTIYISIGNSDDKLSQSEWSNFVTETDILLTPRRPEDDPHYPVRHRHGNWRSLPDDPYQNACWCIEIDDDEEESTNFLWDELAQLAMVYQQDSITWAEATTEFIGPAKVVTL